jgi:hypothetical protein
MAVARSVGLRKRVVMPVSRGGRIAISHLGVLVTNDQRALSYLAG